MSQRSLEDLLQSTQSPVDMLRNLQAGPNVYPGVPAEFTNWRDEQAGLAKNAVLYNQSYHMDDLAVAGPDAVDLLSDLAVNSFEGSCPQGQALRAGHPGRLRDRRRDPVRARRRPSSTSSAARRR